MKFNHLFFALVLCVTFISCKNESPQESTNNIFKFKNYINYTTSGVVSVIEPIKIDLAKEVEGWVANQEISKRVDILTGLFTNPEFQQCNDNSMEVSEQKPDNVKNCTIL